jgi:hypothetical protein
VDFFIWIFLGKYIKRKCPGHFIPKKLKEPVQAVGGRFIQISWVILATFFCFGPGIYKNATWHEFSFLKKE